VQPGAIRLQEHNVQPYQRIPRHSPQIAARVFSGEAVVITPAENMIRMFNQVGSRIWELADGTRSIAEIAAALVLEYEVEQDEAAQQVCVFLDELAHKGLIELVG
jgi:hypothetical protein